MESYNSFHVAQKQVMEAKERLETLRNVYETYHEGESDDAFPLTEMTFRFPA